MLLSFAQLEREVTGEGIRDKIAASKRRHVDGSMRHLGYDLKNRKLLVNSTEAANSGDFRAYLKLGSVRKLKISVIWIPQR